jgi:DNA polymerase elongation subunit (family B)
MTMERSVPIYGLDIETDNSAGHGLDPRRAGVVAVAITVPTGYPLPPEALRHHTPAAGGREVAVLDVSVSDEHRILSVLDQVITSLPPGLLVTWNGAAFDLPFLSDRAAVVGISLGLEMTADSGLECKYGPLNGHDTAYQASWSGHDHLDVCHPAKGWCASANVEWSLKPLAVAAGLNPVVEDRAALHDIEPERRISYVASDAAVTAAVAEALHV